MTVTRDSWPLATQYKGREMATETPEFIVAHVTGDGQIMVHTDDFAPTWSDGTTVKAIEIELADDGWHLIINGIRQDYNSVAIRMPVEFTPDGALRIALVDHLNTTTQTCTGDPCAACTLSGGVCTCSASVPHAHPTTDHCDSTIVITTPATDIFLKQ